MNLWQSLEGQLDLELLTADPAQALDAFSSIPLRNITTDGKLLLCFQIRRRDRRRAAALAEKRGERLRVLRHRGLFWKFLKLKAHPVLVFGMALLVGLTLWLPTRVFFFRVEGNSTVPTGEILAAAEESGLFFGVSRRSIRSEKIKNNLLSLLPQLKWAGVNTKGCVALIRVAEKQPQPLRESEASAVSSIVAARDGVLHSLTVTRGTALCAPGQSVSKGQILISGYTDCGLCVLSQAAQGEAVAFTKRSLQALLPEKRLQKGDTEKIIRRWYLIFGKKRIKLWFGSGILDGECGRMYQEYPLTLPGGFVLPLGLTKEDSPQVLLTPESLPQEEAAAELKDFARDYLPTAMVAGTLRTAAETVFLSEDTYTLRGQYSCLESIGRSRQEQIGETNE